jgi:hypothetical protein
MVATRWLVARRKPPNMEVSMDRARAEEILSAVLDEYRLMSYAELTQLIRSGPAVELVTTPGGDQYQIELQVFWDDSTGGNVRVLGSIDDGGLRALFTLTDDFIMNSSGELVGE